MNLLPTLPIGGFFSEEDYWDSGNNLLHKDFTFLKSGRSCLNFILKVLRPSKLYVPIYQCSDIYSVFKENEVEIAFYKLNKSFEPTNLPRLGQNEYYLYVNYFGIKTPYIDSKLLPFYDKNLIIDNSQAYFDKSQADFSFNSARKFFGVSDGGVLFIDKELTNKIHVNKNNGSINNKHLKLLKEGNREEAFKEYRIAETKFNNTIEEISSYSKKLLSGLNYYEIKNKRRENFKFLHDNLKLSNSLTIENIESSVPFCYPYLPTKRLKRQLLIDKKIYFPKLWPSVLNHCLKKEDNEFVFVEDLLLLPIDQRYSLLEMNYIVNIIEELS